MQGFLPQLQSARGIAAIAVFVSHVAFSSWGGSEEWYSRFGARGAWGVSLFFALSGFLLTRPWVRATQGAERPYLPRYFWHRFVRILPAYWVALLVVLLTTGRGASPGAVVSNIFLLQVYTGDLLPAFALTWSLCTEVAFYVILPFLALLCVRRSPGRSLAIMAVLFVASIAFVGWAAAFGPSGLALGNWLPATLSWFLVGMALAVVAPHLVGESRVWWRRPLPWFLLAAGLYMVSVLPVTGAVGLGGGTPMEAMGLNVLFAAITAAFLFGLVVGRPEHREFGWLTARPMVWFGKISYAFFLWQMLMIRAARNLLDEPYFGGGAVTVGLLSAVLTLAVAQLSWWLVEQPTHRLLTPLVGRRKVTVA